MSSEQYSYMRASFWLTIAGITCNYLSIPLLTQLELVIAPAILLLSVRILPLKWALIPILLVLSHQAWLFGNPYNAILYFFEVLFFAAFIRRQWMAIIIDLLYWLIIGIPLVFFMLEFLLPPIAEGMYPVVIAKQPINGIIYTSVSAALLWIRPIHRLAKQVHPSSTPTQLRRVVRDYLLLLFVAPVVVVVLLAKSNFESNQYQQLRYDLRSQLDEASLRLDDFLQTHATAVNHFAASYSLLENPEATKTEQLTKLHDFYPDFVSMLMTDAEGTLIAASPQELFQPNLSVAERDYYQASKQQRSFVSEGFRGRGFGEDPIVAFSSAIYRQDNFIGVVEGSLNLAAFNIFPDSVRDDRLFYLVLDNNQSIVSFSSPLMLNYLDSVTVKVEADDYFGEIVRLNDLPYEFIFNKKQITNGWTAYSLFLKSDFIADTTNAYIGISANLFISLAISIVAAAMVSSLALHPIRILLARFQSMGKQQTSQLQPTKEFMLEELNTLVRQFDLAYSRLQDAHRQEKTLIEDKLAAEKANESKSLFVSRVSHELRTPLNAILGQVQLIKLEAPDEELAELNSIEQAGKHLILIIDDLMQISKLDVGELQVTNQHVVLNQILEEVNVVLREEFKSSKVSLQSEISATEKSQIFVDATRLKQVLINVIGNAIKYNREDGWVRVNTELNGDTVRIHIQDSGVGIEQEYQKFIFEPFQRLGHAHSQIEGTGLGLTLTRELLLLMGGKIWFESEANKGTVFHIELPLHSSADSNDLAQSDELNELTEQPLQTSDLAVLSLDGVKVLYIEDNRVNFMILQKWLLKMGASQVDNAESGEATLSYLENNQPDVIFVDFGLPDTDGLSLGKVILSMAKFRKTPLLALTADASQKTRQSCLDAGFTGFLTKPVDFEVIERELIFNGFCKQQKHDLPVF